MGGMGPVERPSRASRAVACGRLKFVEEAVQRTAAHAITAKTCLPRAAPGNVGAVHHDTSLDAHPLVDRIVVFLWRAAPRRQS